MYRYAQIDNDGIVVSDSYLSGEVTAPNMIPLAEDFDLTDKKWNGTEWVEYIAPIPEPYDEEKEFKTTILTALADLYEMMLEGGN